MNQKKNSKILVILIILSIIVILIVGAIVAYLSTDILKSNKRLFYKYMGQIGEEKQGFIDENLINYFRKKTQTAYTDSGEILTNVSSGNSGNFNISFSGKVDEANSKCEQEINLNYSDSVNFPITYRQIDNKIGLQTKFVGNKFIAIETEKLGNLSGINKVQAGDTTIKLDTQGAYKLQGLKDIELTEEDKNKIKATYLNIIDQELKDSDFSKVKDEDLTGYKLTLSEEILKNVEIKILENLKNDTQTLDKINEYLKLQKNSLKITASDIDDIIESINNSNSSDEKIEIIVYKQSGKLKKISIITNEIDATIEKEKVNDTNINYIFSVVANIANETIKLNLNVNYTGIKTSQNVNEKYQLEIDTSEGKYQYNLNNNVVFEQNGVNIDEFNDKNCIILTNYKSEKVGKLVNSIVKRIGDVNIEQMQKLRLQPEENPILKLIPPIQLNLNQNPVLNKTQLTEEEINAFNKKFEVYTDSNSAAVTVKGLISTIALNNESEDSINKIKEINFNGQETDASEQNLTFIKSDINTEKNYRVEFEKDQDTGIIYRVVINEK